MNRPADHLDVLINAEHDTSQSIDAEQKAGVYGPTRQMAVRCLIRELRDEYIHSAGEVRLAWVPAEATR
jgi:hypothetical protein